MRERRCALIMLTKPWKELRDMIVNDREFAEAAMAVCMAFDKERYNNMAHLADEAITWLIKALAGNGWFYPLLAEAQEMAAYSGDVTA